MAIDGPRARVQSQATEGETVLRLTRLIGEAVVIQLPDGRVVRVVVNEVGRGKVRLGFDADKTIRIDREEIHLRRLEARGGGEPPHEATA